ncbi:MAG: Rpn family recombination-promoting nuclease/putative transposase, partial [Gracilibacteraceae bacterium]|nr:Rpn family recombination-promoting nuclease/putative transposase [Gracilibacteraceae bacterium]
MLLEHQSSLNRNMPLRLLMYVARLYEKIIDSRSIYMDRLVTVPRPEFIVFYNGAEDLPDHSVLRLSDAFARTDLPEPPPLELAADVYNINDGRNADIMEKCAELRNCQEITCSDCAEILRSVKAS